MRVHCRHLFKMGIPENIAPNFIPNSAQNSAPDPAPNPAEEAEKEKWRNVLNSVRNRWHDIPPEKKKKTEVWRFEFQPNKADGDKAPVKRLYQKGPFGLQEAKERDDDEVSVNLTPEEVEELRKKYAVPEAPEVVKVGPESSGDLIPEEKNEPEEERDVVPTVPLRAGHNPKPEIKVKKYLPYSDIKLTPRDSWCPVPQAEPFWHNQYNKRAASTQTDFDHLEWTRPLPGKVSNGGPSEFKELLFCRRNQVTGDEKIESFVQPFSTPESSNTKIQWHWRSIASQTIPIGQKPTGRTVRYRRKWMQWNRDEDLPPVPRSSQLKKIGLESPRLPAGSSKEACDQKQEEPEPEPPVAGPPPPNTCNPDTRMKLRKLVDDVSTPVEMLKYNLCTHPADKVNYLHDQMSSEVMLISGYEQRTSARDEFLVYERNHDCCCPYPSGTNELYSFVQSYQTDDLLNGYNNVYHIADQKDFRRRSHPNCPACPMPEPHPDKDLQYADGCYDINGVEAYSHHWQMHDYTRTDHVCEEQRLNEVRDLKRRRGCPDYLPRPMVCHILNPWPDFAKAASNIGWENEYSGDWELQYPLEEVFAYHKTCCNTNTNPFDHAECNSEKREFKRSCHPLTCPPECVYGMSAGGDVCAPKPEEDNHHEFLYHLKKRDVGKNPIGDLDLHQHECRTEGWHCGKDKPGNRESGGTDYIRGRCVPQLPSRHLSTTSFRQPLRQMSATACCRPCGRLTAGCDMPPPYPAKVKEHKAAGVDCFCCPCPRSPICGRGGPNKGGYPCPGPCPPPEPGEYQSSYHQRYRRLDKTEPGDINMWDSECREDRQHISPGKQPCSPPAPPICKPPCPPDCPPTCCSRGGKDSLGNKREKAGKEFDGSSSYPAGGTDFITGGISGYRDLHELDQFTKDNFSYKSTRSYPGGSVYKPGFKEVLDNGGTDFIRGGISGAQDLDLQRLGRLFSGGSPDTKRDSAGRDCPPPCPPPCPPYCPPCCVKGDTGNEFFVHQKYRQVNRSPEGLVDVYENECAQRRMMEEPFEPCLPCMPIPPDCCLCSEQEIDRHQKYRSAGRSPEGCLDLYEVDCMDQRQIIPPPDPC